MKPAAENTIALSLEGTPADEQHVRLEDFVCQLKALQIALNCVDVELHGKPTLYYRVVDLSHSSPATVRLQMVLRESYRTIQNRAKFGHSPEEVHHRFFDSLKAIRFQNERIPNTSEETIEAFSELVSGIGKSFTTGAIFNGVSHIPLDAGLYENLSNQTKPSFVSNGSVIGDLLAISFAKGNKFYIYPQIGPTSVSCNFDGAKLEKQARGCIKKRVRVFGEKYFRSGTGLPFKVNVSAIEEIITPKTFVTLSPKRPAHKGIASHESIANLRDEWTN